MTHETTSCGVAALVLLAYTGMFVAWGAYALWDIGVRKGDFALLSAVSYAIPVLSTLTSSIVLGVPPAWRVWAGIVMVTAGAVLCRLATGESGPTAAGQCPKSPVQNAAMPN